ncbi:MAG: ATP synthase F1 subunit gamma [Parcubacteria group bacterium]|nr:ATP synthase F1 subunit gamma [Parcubacteria group bacterium]MCR4342863.1 ATP synthase F1 subunit gamma [Patescibacteria group bacterium]
MAKIKEIKSRIKSVSNTKKVTRAMEMVSAAKMRKAIESVLNTRTYANSSWEIILNLAGSINGKSTPHPLLAKRQNIEKIGIILITSNRGLCGGFNTALINKVIHSIKKHQESGDKKIETDFILLGKKGASVCRNYGYNIAADFPKLDLNPEFKEVAPVAKIIIDGFLSGKYDKIMVAYTDFINAVNQAPRVKQLLPVDINSDEEYLGVVGEDTRVGLDKKFIEEKEKKHLNSGEFKYEYIFEPNPEEVLDKVVPRLIEIQLYQALLESTASEHSARMTAMHKATDSASEMVQDLTLFYNKARQGSITAEIAEISAGAEALNK